MFDLTVIIETASLILGAYLAGCLLGYGSRRVLHAARGRRQVAVPVAVPEPSPAPPAKRVPSPAARLAMAASREDVPTAPTRRHSPADGRPPVLANSRNGLPDNLKRIKGIGPKIEASLHALGIFHFDQIAAWTRPETEWIDAHLGFKGRIRRERWVEQAAELARIAA